MSELMNPIYVSDLAAYIQRLVKIGSDIKSNAVPAMFRQEKLPQNKREAFSSAVLTAMKYWDEYGQKLRQNIKITDPMTGIRIPQWSNVREWIYANYDYDSVLLLADGIIRGINDRKIKNPDDIISFKDHVCSKAFGNLPDEIPDLLTDVTTATEYKYDQPSTAADVGRFKAIKSYEGLINRHTGMDMYKSIITAVLTTIDNMTDIVKSYENRNVMKTAILNTIVDYAVYSMSVFICRIYAIMAYVYPFISADRSANGTKGYDESVTSASQISDNDVDELVGSNRISKFIDTDDIVYKDLENFDVLKDDLKNLCNRFGTEEIKTFTNALAKDKVFGPLIDNELIRTVHDWRTGTALNMRAQINELHTRIKESMFNSQHALEGTYSPKHQILHAIASMDPVKDVGESVRSMYAFYVEVVGDIRSILQWLSRTGNMDDVDVTARNHAIECSKMILELYREIIGVIVDKCRDIEKHYNDRHDQVARQTMNMLSIRVPGEQKSDISTPDNMMSSIPATTRMPAGVESIYQTQAFESVQLYNEMIKMYPEFANDMYFNEAINIDVIINKLIAALVSVSKKWRYMFNNPKFQEAVKWTTEHEAEIRGWNYSSITMDVLPYKKTITVPANFNNLKLNLSQINDSHLRNHDALQGFIKTLYPSEIVYGWFTDKDENKRKTAPVRYKNLILFFDDPTRCPDSIPATVKQSGNQLRETVGDWIDTMKSSQSVYQEFSKMDHDIDTAVKMLKNKVLTMTRTGSNTSNDQGKNNEDKSNTTPPAVNVSQEQKQGSTTNLHEAGEVSVNNGNQSTPKSDDKTESKDMMIGTAITEISNTVNNIWGALHDIFIEYTMNQYNSLKDLYVSVTNAINNQKAEQTK